MRKIPVFYHCHISERCLADIVCYGEGFLSFLKIYAKSAALLHNFTDITSLVAAISIIIPNFQMNKMRLRKI